MDHYLDAVSRDRSPAFLERKTITVSDDTSRLQYTMARAALTGPAARDRADRILTNQRIVTTMYTMSHLAIALFIGGGIGGFLGWYFAVNSRGDNKRKVIMDLESQLDQAAQSRADYEAEVTEHFAQTADLLHKLTDDYRAVYTHLADGAEQLCGDQVSISEAALTATDEDAKRHLVEVAQPLDYAPKKPDEQGQLSETFGLDQSNGTAA